MAMPPGNVIASDKLQFPAGGGQWMVDERDGFISWLRSEFAAANAIIDSLCNHLHVVGDPSEYDSAFSSINQRRINWTPVLLMQQYFPVADVTYTLEQIAWKKQQRHQNQQQRRGPFADHQGRFAVKEFRRPGVGFSKHDQNEKTQEAASGSSNVVKMMQDKGSSLEDESKQGSEADAGTKASLNGSHKNSEDSEESSVSNVENQAGIVNHKGISDDGNKSASDQNQNESNPPKTFVATEIYDGKPVNCVDGLKLYKDVLDSKEVSKLVSMVNDLRVSGKRGQLLGQTYVLNKRPMRGHGREVIQLGLPIADAPIDDEVPTGNSKGSGDRSVEPIPAFLQEVVDRLVDEQIAPVKPDSCIIDFYNEGDHSQPNMFVPWFERPVCLVLLSECDMTFGRVIVSDNPGDFKGSLKLSLTPGSFLVMQGKSADFSRHAINSIRKQRMIITFIKSIPRKSLPGPTQSSLVPWGPPPSRSPNRVRQPSRPINHYAGVLPMPPPPQPQIRTPNGIPLFASASVTPAVPFSAVQIPITPGPTRWAAVAAAPPSRHPPPLAASPGTGVFLPPPGSGSPPNSDPGSSQERENDFGKPDNRDSTTPKDNLDDDKVEPGDCNGKIVDKEEWNVDPKPNN